MKIKRKDKIVRDKETSIARDTLERELVVMDKQKLITQGLKLYDATVMLQNIIDNRNLVIEANETLIQGQRDEIIVLEGRRWVNVLNDNIRARIERIRSRRSHEN